MCLMAVAAGCHTRLMARLCVFCGSSSGFDPAYVAAASLLGREIAGAGHELVYGGGHVGLMGVVADAALDSGAEVTGVITESLLAAEVAHEGLTKLVISKSMHDRKERMADLSDGVIVLPGGFGTLDETFEIITWNQLGLISMPVVFLDVANYFSALFSFIAGSVDAGFMNADHGDLARRVSSPIEAVRIAAGPAASYRPKWVDGN